jgi:choline-sulfatase
VRAGARDGGPAPAAALAVVVAGLCLSACGPPAPRADGPRLLVVTIDTLRADTVGVYGGPFPTPALDGIAAAGALFLDAHTPTPTTEPAHVSLWTGLHPWRHGVLDNAVPLAPTVQTVAAAAAAAGIPAAAFVSSYILASRFGLSQGFDTYHFEPTEHDLWRGRERPAFWTRAGYTTDAALAWLRAHRRGPFLLWVHYFDPHSPYEPPKGWERPVSERIVLEGKRLPPGIATFAQLADLIRGYRGDVAYTDAELGRLLAGLRSLGILDRTTVIAAADHGEGLGDHGTLEHGENLFEELVHIPLVVQGPGIPAGRRLAGPVQLEDLAPTALELLGLPVPPGLDGVSLVAWLRGESDRSPHTAVVGRRKDYPGRPDLFYVWRDRTKWIGTLGGTGKAYALDGDPHEAAGTAARMPGALAEQLPAARAGATARPVLDDESRRALQALGYLER